MSNTNTALIWSEGKSLATRDDILAVIAVAGIDVGPIADRIDATEIAKPDAIPPRRQSAACSARRPSSSAKRCSSATIGSISCARNSRAWRKQHDQFHD